MSINNIINQRIKLQSTQDEVLKCDKSLDHPVKIINCIKTKKYSNWPENLQNKFIIAIGGRANFNKTKNYLRGI